MKKKIIAVLCAAAMAASSGMPAYAKAKTTYITPSSTTVKVNAKKVITLKNNTKAVRWSTSTKNVALSKKTKKSVTVTGRKAGSATVTAKVGKKTYKAKIKVTKVGLSTTKKTLKKNASFTLKMSGKKVKLWSVSSSKTVLKLTKKTATSVKVTAVGTGSATVIAETVKPYKMYKCRVTVPSGSTKGTTGGSTKTGTAGTTGSTGSTGSTAGTSTASGTSTSSSSTSRPSSSSGTSAGNTVASDSTASSGSTAAAHEHTWTPTYKAVSHPAEYRDNVMRARLVPSNCINLSATDYWEFPVDANGNIVDVMSMTTDEIVSKGLLSREQAEEADKASSAWIDHCIDDLGHTYSTLIYYLDANGNPTTDSQTMVKAAYTEYVIDGYRCTTCGATKSA